MVGNLNILHFAKNVAAQDSYLNTQSHRHRAEMTENGEINHLQDISVTGAMYVCMHRCNIWSLMFPQFDKSQAVWCEEEGEGCQM